MITAQRSFGWPYSLPYYGYPLRYGWPYGWGTSFAGWPYQYSWFKSFPYRMSLPTGGYW